MPEQRGTCSTDVQCKDHDAKGFCVLDAKRVAGRLLRHDRVLACEMHLAGACGLGA